MTRVRLLLFDIDLTLLRYRPKNANRGAMVETFAALCGLPAADVAFTSVAGKTDPLIVAEIFKKNERPYTPETDYPQFMARYLKKLKISCERHERVRLPGVHRLLSELTGQRDIYRLGVLTGNDERGAAMKLDSVGLRLFFPIGAFGSDAAEREKLLPFALRRAKHHYGIDFGPGQTVIIGDSTRDVIAAKAHGAHALGVATGYDSRDQLLDAGADRVVDDLKDTSRVLSILATLGN